jgi:inorganic pyrophosphatase
MKLSSGKNPPKQINVFIEIPQTSRVKYELDKKTGAIFVDRFLHTAMVFPFNYGFIPKTLAQDKDPVDVMVISSQQVIPGVVIPSRPIGLLEMEDEAGIDTKIAAVPDEKIDPNMNQIKDVKHLSISLKNQIKHFFEHYKELEPNKWVKIKNWQGREVAEKEIKKCLL